MKAERRHQLQDNALAKHLETFPEMLKRNASRIMLGITAVLVVVFIVRYRMNATAQRQVTLSQSLLQVREGPKQILLFDRQSIPPEQLARIRAQATSEINAAIETVLREAEGSDGAPMRAEALLARGNLNWSLANVMPIPGAATQPSLQLPRSSDDYLKSAEDAYRDVVTSYSAQIVQWTAAQMGLAAIAENRHEWDAARAAYGEILARADVPASFQQVAQIQLSVLPDIQSPVMLSAYPPSTQSTTESTTQELTTQGLITQPTTRSTAAPDFLPVLPTTAPISAPISGPASAPTSKP